MAYHGPAGIELVEAVPPGAAGPSALPPAFSSAEDTSGACVPSREAGALGLLLLAPPWVDEVARGWFWEMSPLTLRAKVASSSSFSPSESLTLRREGTDDGVEGHESEMGSSPQVLGGLSVGVLSTCWTTWSLRIDTTGSGAGLEERGEERLVL